MDLTEKRGGSTGSCEEEDDEREERDAREGVEGRGGKFLIKVERYIRKLPLFLFLFFYFLQTNLAPALYRYSVVLESDIQLFDRSKVIVPFILVDLQAPVLS